MDACRNRRGWILLIICSCRIQNLLAEHVECSVAKDRIIKPGFEDD